MKNKDKFIDKSFLKNLLLYTVIFNVIAIFILYIYHKNGKIIMNSADAFHQHVIMFQYYRELLVNFIRTGQFSTFSWNIGFGYDLLSDLLFATSGDIFSYFSLLVPTSMVDELFSFLPIVRMFLTGITFLIYCRYHKMSNNASIIGALMYTFSAYCVLASVTHPFFTNALIIFPLVMIGIEKIIIEDKVLYYTLIIAFAFVVNFYFSYMMAIGIAIYGIVLAIYSYKEEGIKKILKVLLKTLLYSILGILLTGIVLLPTFFSFITSERTSVSTLPYSLNYYQKFLPSLLSVTSNGQWTFLGVSSLIMISLPWFVINRKKNYPLFITLMILIIPLLSARVGSIFSFFNFTNNRWTFIMAFIFSLITVEFINSNDKLSKKELLAICCLTIIYLFSNLIFNINLNVQIEMQLIILIFFIIYYLYKEDIRKKFKLLKSKYIPLTILTIGILYTNYYFFGVQGYNYTSTYIDDGNGYNNAVNTARNQIPDFTKALNFIKKEDYGFYRIEKFPNAIENIVLTKKYNSVGLYFSLTPNLYGKLNMDLSNKDYRLNRGVKDFDYRTKIMTLLGNKYLIQYTELNKNSIPYGYTKMTDYKGKSTIYKNDYALPFGVLYTNYITEDEYENLSPLEKESSLLKATVLENGQGYNHYSNDYNNTINSISYEIIDKNKVVNNNIIKIKNTFKSSFQLNIEDVKNSEIYISFDKLKYEPFTKQEMINLALVDDNSKYNQEKVKNQYKWYQPSKAMNIKVAFKGITKTLNEENPRTSPYYIDRSNYLFNLGYYDEASGSITITLTELGNYTFEDLKVYAVSMDDYAKDIESLRKSNFEVTDYGNGYLNGTANIEENGILQFSTIYREGWDIYVDGQKVETCVSNKYFLGINITTGNHKIEMKYHNPYIKIGSFISLGSLVVLGVLLYFNKKSKKDKNKVD